MFISFNTPVFVVIKPVGSSAGGSVSGLAGLETCLNIKKKCIESIYSHVVSYKKLKKPDAGGVLVNLSIGSLILENIGISGDKLIVFWENKIRSVASSVNDLSDVENMANIIAKEISYAESNKNNDINDAIPRKTHI
ncbi:hypothetical protein G9A89_022074 [Geosiphon pyriformis]|nr:hypothetical protein G9A89_022074 [Geosiphon pyriformis]